MPLSGKTDLLKTVPITEITYTYKNNNNKDNDDD